MAIPGADALMADAEARTGLRDWGWFDIKSPLEALTGSLNAEARLTERGERACHERLSFVLANRLRMIEDRRRWPQIAAEEVRRPVIIPGLPRSGTTMLLQILAQDPANRSPLTWEILAPSPPPQSATFATDPRIAEVQSMLDRHGFTRPELMAMHAFDAELADECIFILEHAMTFTPYGAFWDTPSYGAWCARADDRGPYKVHKEVLQQLQFRAPAERWVLKAPNHMQHLPALVETYPDAVFIQTHRDLGRIIPSLAKLFGALRRTFTDDPAKADIVQAARGQLSAWTEGLNDMTQFRKDPAMDARFVDLNYKTTLADPIGAVEKVYSKFDLPLSAEAKSRMERWLAENRQGRHGAHEYSLAECGLTERDIDEHFGEYMERYGVTREERI
ncbi:MAG: sulfotransferase [Caulobacteraceae bacterium]|nr:sulfotransferase [Caulobacteraceae bacterium]